MGPHHLLHPRGASRQASDKVMSVIDIPLDMIVRLHDNVCVRMLSHFQMYLVMNTVNPSKSLAGSSLVILPK